MPSRQTRRRIAAPRLLETWLLTYHQQPQVGHHDELRRPGQALPKAKEAPEPCFLEDKAHRPFPCQELVPQEIDKFHGKSRRVWPVNGPARRRLRLDPEDGGLERKQRFLDHPASDRVEFDTRFDQGPRPLATNVDSTVQERLGEGPADYARIS